MVDMAKIGIEHFETIDFYRKHNPTKWKHNGMGHSMLEVENYTTKNELLGLIIWLEDKIRQQK